MDVWLVALEGDPAIPLEYESGIVLSPDETERAARLRFESDRARWIRARSALRVILSGCTGIPAADLRFLLGTHGKPSIADGDGVEFSLSHSGSWAMVAVTQGIPVGVDIERIRENVNIASLLTRLGETNLPADQAALFQAWTRREAMTKAAGGALMEPPVGDFRLRNLPAPAGYSAAVALLGREPQVRFCSTQVPSSGTVVRVL